MEEGLMKTTQKEEGRMKTKPQKGEGLQDTEM